MSSRFQITLALLPLFFICPVRADDWPMFGRNQTRNAVSPEKNPPTWWQPEEQDKEGKLLKPGKNIRWSVDLNGPDGFGKTYGDPVVVDGMIWVGTNNGNRKEDAAVLVCVEEKTGKVLYRYLSPRLDPDRYDWKKSMACSPLIEGERMWFATNRSEVVCLDIAPLKARKGDPRELWKVDMRKEFGVYRTAYCGDSHFCSIASHKDLIFVITGNGINLDDRKPVAPEAPSLVCFNKNTGKVVWKDSPQAKDILFGQYASPTVIEVEGQTQVVAPQGDGWVRAFAATTGKLLWKFDTNPPDAVRKRFDHGTRNELPASAVFHENRLYIGNGQDPEMGPGPAWLYCIDPTKTGDISPQVADGPGKSKPNPNLGMVWKFGGVDEKSKEDNFSRTVSNIAIDRGLVIASDIDGWIHCLDAQTGRQCWVHDAKAIIYGSPLIVDGKIYVGTDNGDVWILDLAKEKKVLGQVKMNDVIKCSPIFANGVLYVATSRQLFAIAGNEKQP